MDHRKEGLVRLGKSYAFLGCSLGFGVLSLMDMASGQTLLGGLKGVFSGVAFLMGAAEQIYARDLLNRAPGDFFPPDPFIKEVSWSVEGITTSGTNNWPTGRVPKASRTMSRPFCCKCPRCREGDLYESPFTLSVRPVCPVCGLDLTRADSADGPAVFLIFILGALLVPMALIFETAVAPPLWVHGVVWGTAALGITLLALRPLKAWVVRLQYRHRPWDRS